jgi:hypothetical protein
MAGGPLAKKVKQLIRILLMLFAFDGSNNVHPRPRNTTARHSEVFPLWNAVP